MSRYDIKGRPLYPHTFYPAPPSLGFGLYPSLVTWATPHCNSIYKTPKEMLVHDL